MIEMNLKSVISKRNNYKNSFNNSGTIDNFTMVKEYLDRIFNKAIDEVEDIWGCINVIDLLLNSG